VIVPWLCGAVALTGCAAPPLPQNGQARAFQAASLQPVSGALVVYSATFPPTSEQSEYPVHTDYTIAETNGPAVERVRNRTGAFGADPQKVTLAVGRYQVRAQYLGGQFVVVPVLIEAGKTTVIGLDGRPPPRGSNAGQQPIGLPNGSVVGWTATGDREP
jgi:hypothetical protein